MATIGYTASQVRAAEAPLLASGIPLMTRAAARLAEHTLSLLPVVPGEGRKGRVTVLAGPGNNGGDALFAAARLAAEGICVTVIPIGDRLHEAGHRASENAGATIVEPGLPQELLVAATTSADVIVDGILGIGSGGAASGGRPALRGQARDFVRALREHAHLPPVVAVDLPSGIDPDDGTVPEPDAVLPAALTVTFIAAKAGLLLKPASGYAGRVIVEDLGVADSLATAEPAVTVPLGAT